ncbi:arrestin domain-containing protein 17-like isoform X2 [Sitodiplosis mosellana]|uniref:arrestin domain-containing protein 17-like isoform X2 n=1 Tax=Sitodiplosis mosellana TaxID=263140 RepID=UPI002443BEF0|nr:arrestin domain-containing protein 17-like isoform X2 [Sitodiplosis mosellana]
MPTTCQINFENNAQKIVYSGQKLHITVRLKLTEEINVRSLHIHGTAHVEFFQDDKKRNGYYTADENVLDIRKCLSGGNGKIQVLPLGTHDYSCTCNLPRNIPSSFSGAYGHIKYTANVVLGISLRPDETFEEKFHVFKSVNLNDYPSLQAEVLDHHTRKLLAHEEFQISISTRLPARGYACGQTYRLSKVCTQQT